MSRNQYEAIMGLKADNDEEYIPSWSSRNTAMRALAQGIPQREPGA